MSVGPVGTVEVALPYNGDYQLQANNDLALLQDDVFAAAATNQRITFLVLTNPALSNDNGVAVCEPDDMFHCKWGSGCRALVGSGVGDALYSSIETSLLNALSRDPGVMPVPAPTLAFAQGDGKTIPLSTILVTIGYQPVVGPYQTIPDIPLGGSLAA